MPLLKIWSPEIVVSVFEHSNHMSKQLSLIAFQKPENVYQIFTDYTVITEEHVLMPTVCSGQLIFKFIYQQSRSQAAVVTHIQYIPLCATTTSFYSLCRCNVHSYTFMFHTCACFNCHLDFTHPYTCFCTFVWCFTFMTLVQILSNLIFPCRLNHV